MERFIDVFGLKNCKKLPDDELYVMLMLMRASEGSEPAKADCEDPMIKAACLLDSDKCPAECKDSEDKEDNTVVKSGDLAVSAEAAANRKILKTGISDLDTITFKTSEDVTINKITLERYGYSDSDASKITGIWLEDEDGNVIADSKTLSKDKVTLNIKKDYRKVDGTYVATIVVETADAEGTIGFKVTDVDSTAKNLNVDKYSPYTYEVVSYASSTVTVEVKGSDKDYNYEEGKSYEIARFKVKAGNKDILVKGMTLTNAGSLDMKEFLDELTVTVDSKEVKAKASVNKDDKLVVTFNEDIELAMNKSAIIVLTASLKDFDKYGDSVKYGIAEAADFNAVETKNGTRVSLTNNALTGKLHKFAGGKIKISSTRLGNVDAAQASEGTVIAEGNINITEPISKISFDITAKDAATYVEKMTMVIDGNDENDAKSITRTNEKGAVYSFVSQFGEGATKTYKGEAEVISSDDSETVLKITKNTNSDGSEDAGTKVFLNKKVSIKQGVEKEVDKISKVYLGEDVAGVGVKGDQIKDGTDPLILTDVKLVSSATADVTFHFENISIDKSAKIQFKVDIKDDATAGGTFTPASFGAAAFAENSDADRSYHAKYDDSNNKVKYADVSGSISFSKVTIQPAKASLTNSYTKDQEFRINETNRKQVFEGTYTAKKGDIDLNKFIVSGTAPANGDKVTFFLFIDNVEVADTDALDQEESFSDVTVKAGKSVDVRVEAEVEAYKSTTANTLGKYSITILGTDVNGNENTGKGTAKTATMKIVEKGSITVSAGTAKNTVLKKAAGEELAQFTVKPSKGGSEVDLEDLEFTLVNGTEEVITSEDDLTIKVGNSPLDDCSYSSTTKTVSCSITNETIPSEGKTVSIVLDEEASGTITLTLSKINGKPVTNTFKKRFESALVSVESQTNNNGTTTFVLGVDNDDDLTITHLELKFDTAWDENDATTKYNYYYDVISDGDDLTDIKGVKDSPRLLEEISYYVEKDGDYKTADNKCIAGTVGITALPVLNGTTRTPAVEVAAGSEANATYCKVTIAKANYADFFKIGSQNIQAFASNK